MSSLLNFHAILKENITNEMMRKGGKKIKLELKI
jgi:hypothetical protein